MAETQEGGTLPEPMFRHPTDSPNSEAARNRPSRRRENRRKAADHRDPNSTPSPPLTPHTNNPPNTSKTHPTRISTLTLRTINNCRGNLRVAYCNANHAYINTDTALQVAQHFDILWIGEPHIYNDPLGCANHPSFRWIIPINTHTKIVGYLNMRYRKLTKGSINRAWHGSHHHHCTNPGQWGLPRRQGLYRRPQRRPLRSD